MSVERKEIISAISLALSRMKSVRAFWEGGSAAYGRVDRWSDLDLYALVTPGSTKRTFTAIEKSLSALSPIFQTYPVSSGWEGVEQNFYRLKHASEYAVVDMAVLTKDSGEMFITPEIHGDNVFYFDKDGIEERFPFDPVKFRKMVGDRKNRAKARFYMFDNHVQKELNRGNGIEALENYRNITIGILVELLRMKHNPVHFDFKMRYVHYELPQSVVERLERLCYVRDEADLKKKHAEAANWILRLLEEGKS